MTQFNLATSEGGRAYIAELFKTRLNTHSYTRYITERLAADFACVLAQWFEDNHPLDAQEPVELLASRMVKAWALAHGRPAPWATAVEIMATITKQSDAEKAALLALDEQSHPDLVGYCREKNIQRMRAGVLSGFMVEDEQHGEACIALFTRPTNDNSLDVQGLLSALAEWKKQAVGNQEEALLWQAENEDLRAQLANRNPLLAECRENIRQGLYEDDPAWDLLARKIDGLSAAADPGVSFRLDGQGPTHVGSVSGVVEPPKRMLTISSSEFKNTKFSRISQRGSFGRETGSRPRQVARGFSGLDLLQVQAEDEKLVEIRDSPNMPDERAKFVREMSASSLANFLQTDESGEFLHEITRLVWFGWWSKASPIQAGRN